MKITAIILSIIVLLSCEKNSPKNMDNSSSINPDLNESAYLAIGDSYTIGEAVSLQNSFPYQLSNSMKNNGLDLGKPYIIAKTGWTSSELQSAIKTAGIQRQFKIVTLLIGVNNQYRGESKDVYRKEFKELLQTAIGFAAGNKAHVFVVSIPDWGVTPFGLNSGRGQEQISAEIDAFNAINKEETLAQGLSYTDITTESRLAISDPGLVAGDGLHPSAKMYADWTALLLPSVLKALK